MPDTTHAVGRPLSTRLAEDLATLFLFSRKDSSVNVNELSHLLGTNAARTAEILTMVSCASSGAHDDREAPLVPLLEEDETGTRRRVGIGATESKWAVRLTDSQAEALGRALDQVGVAPIDPLRQRLMAAFAPAGYTDEAREQEIEPGCTEALLMCARSLARASRGERGSFEQPALRFMYRTEKDFRERSRLAVPRRLHVAAGQWQLDAYDLDARRMRTFLVADMSDIALDETPSLAPPCSEDAEETRMVRLTCAHEAEPEVLRWDGAHKVGRDRKVTFIEVPYYYGDRLPRQILSMRGLVTCEDEDVREVMAAIVREDLKLAATLGA